MEVYELIKAEPTQNREDLAEKLGKNEKTIQRTLNKLLQEGKIKRIGSNKTGYWEARAFCQATASL